MKQYLKYWCSPGYSGYPSNALPGGALQCRPSIISCLFSSRQSFMNIIIYPMTSSYVDHPSPIPYCILIRVASSVLENKWKWILKYEQPKMNVSVCYISIDLWMSFTYWVFVFLANFFEIFSECFVLWYYTYWFSNTDQIIKMLIVNKI